MKVIILRATDKFGKITCWPFQFSSQHEEDFFDIFLAQLHRLAVTDPTIGSILVIE